MSRMFQLSPNQGNWIISDGIISFIEYSTGDMIWLDQNVVIGYKTHDNLIWFAISEELPETD